MAPDHPHWFSAKRYGWGWGLRSPWQGWIVLAAFVGLVVAGTAFFPPRRALVAYLVYVTCLSLVLIGIAWLKGEPPRWRWGADTVGRDR